MAETPEIRLLPSRQSNEKPIIANVHQATTLNFDKTFQSLLSTTYKIVAPPENRAEKLKKHFASNSPEFHHSSVKLDDENTISADHRKEQPFPQIFLSLSAIFEKVF